MALAINFFVDAIKILTLIAAGLSTFKGLRDTILGLQAKRDLRRVIAAKHDTMLASFAEKAAKKKLNDSEIERAKHRIEQYLAEIPTDRAAEARRGLTQQNKKSERRYVQDIISKSA